MAEDRWRGGGYVRRSQETPFRPRWGHGGGGRGGRRWGRQFRGGYRRRGGWDKPHVTREQLDKELDSYMSHSRHALDKDLDEYMRTMDE